MHKILVVEDDTTINQVICEFLKENHYEVTPVFDGAEALRIFEEKSYLSNKLIINIYIAINPGPVTKLIVVVGAMMSIIAMHIGKIPMNILLVIMDFIVCSLLFLINNIIDNTITEFIILL